MVYDVTTPSSPSFVQYVNTRDFAITPGTAGETTDLHPENVTIVKASDSPTGKTLVVVSYQVSGSAVVFEFDTTSASAASAVISRVDASAGGGDAPRVTTDRPATRRALSLVAESPTRRLAATDRAFTAQPEVAGSQRSRLYASRGGRTEVEAAVALLSTSLARSLGRE
jgi:hypothetical protein